MDGGELVTMGPTSGSTGVALPITFTVGATIKRMNGGGHVTISPGSVLLEPGPTLRRASGVDRVEHTEPKIALLHTRIAPPWINTSIVISGEGQTAVASTWFGMRRRLRATLQAAGFTVDQQAAWFSLGGGLTR